ncbi:MAG TPA: ester cyclase, partial [Solirubrobacteraceae bacterium]|nr:ester cyclase [Solirubrobacteraceae bacterium]
MAADAREVAESYFAALARRDLDAAAACWAPDGVDNLVGQAVAEGPTGVRAFFAELFAAIPDFAMEVETIVAEGDRAAVRWHATGTFAGESAFQGIAPTGARVTLTGFDLLEVRDG